MAPRTKPESEENVVVTEDNVPEKAIQPDTLYSALIKAELAFTPILKDKVNPHFNSKYADLDSIMDSIREPLLNNNLFVSSFFEYEEEFVFLVTRITHAPTMDYLQIRYKVTLTGNEQAKGSTQMYARRYSICDLLNLTADVDDDGNSAVKSVEVQPLSYSKKECLEWAEKNTPYCHASDDERILKFDAFAKKGHYDTASKWKIGCWENRDRYNPNKSTSTPEVAQ